MGKLRPIYTIILAISMLAMASCDREYDRKKPMVGLSQCGFDTQWRLAMNRNYLAEAMVTEKFDLAITNGELDNANQISDITDSLAARGAAAIIISPNDTEGLTSTVDELYKNGMPIVLVDRKTSDTNYTCFIGASNFYIGSMAADAVAEFQQDGADILEIYGFKGSSSAEDRSGGFNTRLSEQYSKRNFKYLGHIYCDYSMHKADSAMEAYLNEHIQDPKPCPDVVYCHNDDMAIGVSHAITRMGFDVDSVLIIGTDGVAGDSAGMKAVLDKVIDVTFLYPDGAHEAAKIVERILDGDTTVPKNIELQSVRIDQNNIEVLYGQASLIRKHQNNIIHYATKSVSQEGQIGGLWKSILIGSLVCFIMFCLLVHTVKLHIKNKRVNQELNEKNAEINAQKEELETQTAFLNEANQQLERSKEMILGSIRYAKTIQTAALPAEQDLNSTFKSFILYQPKDIVSGDFYWYHREDVDGIDVHLAGVIDCTGHGVPGAFMSLIGVNLLDQIVKQRKIFSPAAILEELNKAVRESLRQTETDNNDGMEAILCRIDRLPDGTMELTYEGAKFPVYHYIKETGEVEICKSSRRQVGGKFRNLEAMVKFEDRKMKISKGDRLYMSSDGIGDQNNEQRKRYTQGRLVEKLKESAQMPIQEQKEYIYKDVFSFMLGCQQRDDITVLGMEV